MSKLKRNLLLLMLLLSCMVAKAFEVNGIAYTITSSSDSSDYTVSVTSKSLEYAGDITIPSSVSYEGITYRVTSIGSRAFRYCDALKRVTLPTTITSIGEDAFRECSSLTSVNIPNSITSQ